MLTNKRAAIKLAALFLYFHELSETVLAISSRRNLRHRSVVFLCLSADFPSTCCRNPHCTRYGISPNPHAGVGRSGGDSDHGYITGSGSERTFTCPACGSHNTLISNRAVAQEYSRTARLHRRPFRGDACQREVCQNFGISITLMPSVYRAFGRTANADPRRQCKGCGGTF